MSLKISTKEFENVTKLNPFDRYKYFIKKVVDSETLYSLQNLNNNMAIAEIENNKVLSFWSAIEFAQQCAVDEWRDYIVVKFTLGFFNEKILPEIKANAYLLNIFSVKNQTGFIVNAEEFIRDIDQEMEYYQ